MAVMDTSTSIGDAVEELRSLLAEVQRRMPLDYQRIEELLATIEHQSNQLETALNRRLS